jgi:hypothetical protein
LYRELPAAGRRISSDACRLNRNRGGFVLPTPEQVRRRIPYGFVLLERAAGEARLRQWADSPPGRGDGAATRAAVAAQVLVQYAKHPTDDLIVFGHQRLAEQVTAAGRPVSRQTVQRVVQELVRGGILMVAQPGVSKQITGTRNHVAVYAIIGPDPAFATELDEQGKAQLEALQRRLVDVDGHPPVRQGDLVKVGGEASLDLGEETSLRPAVRHRPELFVPRDDARERWAAAGWLLGWLGWLFDDEEHRRLAQNLRPFFAAGWCPDAIAVALQRDPDGALHRTPLQDDALVHDHGALIMHRLKTWRGPDRRPLPPPAAAHRRRRGPMPAWLAAEQSAALPTSAGLQRATTPPPAARAALTAAVAAGKAASAASLRSRTAVQAPAPARLHHQHPVVGLQ